MLTALLRQPILCDEQAALNYVRGAILDGLRVINGNNNLIEVRILNTPHGVLSGYFNDMEKLCDEVLPYNGKHNIFLTLNPCPKNLAVSTNKLHQHSKNTTKDSDIVSREWILIDIDPKRPSGTSSTNEEHNYALNKATEIAGFLTSNGFPVPVFADSGNGTHLLYKTSMPNDSESTAVIKAFLNALAKRFSDDGTDVDTSVYNAARICKLYGTKAVKGENTHDRPHRQSKILQTPPEQRDVSVVQLTEIVSVLTPSEKQDNAPVKIHVEASNRNTTKFDIEAFIKSSDLEVVSVTEDDTKKIWRISCPFKEHEDKAAYIQQFKEGAISAGCHHDKCKWDWKDLRAKFDTAYARKQAVYSEHKNDELPAPLIPYNTLLTSKKPNMCIDSAGHILIQQGAQNLYWAMLANFVPIPHKVTYWVEGTTDKTKHTVLTIGGYLEGTKKLHLMEIELDKLHKSKWHIDLDVEAIVSSDVRGGNEKLTEIVQYFVERAERNTIYSHLGFRSIEGKLCYLHANGAIGLKDVSVDLTYNNLSGYEFEDTSGLSADDKRICAEEALKLFDLHRYGNVLFAYTFLAPLCDMFAKIDNMPSFSLWLHGRSDSQKSTVAALLLNFFGKGFAKNNLPLSFNDTENSMSKKLYLCKDSLAVIDDVLHPTANHNDMKKQKKLAQDMIFNIANRTGRGRMKADESLRTTFTPKGMVIFTAEYPFDNVSESTTARLLCLEFEKGSVNLDVLTDCQKSTLSFNKTMTGYIEWLITNNERITAELQAKFNDLREKLSTDSEYDTMKKLVEICAFMLISMDYALQYLLETGVIDSEYKNSAISRLQSDMQTLTEKQSSAITLISPTKQFLDVIPNLLSDGTIYTKPVSGSDEQIGGRMFVGWHDKDRYYFFIADDTGNVYIAVKQYYRQHGMVFDIQPKELYRRLKDDGIVTETEKGRPNKVKTIKGKQYRVLVIPREVFGDCDCSDEERDKLFPIE